MKIKFLNILILSMFFIISGCNSNNSSTPPDDTNSVSNNNVIKLNILKNNMVSMYDLKTSYKDKVFNIESNHKNIKLIDNRYLVILPSFNIDNRIKVKLNYQENFETQQINYEFSMKENNDISGLYHYNIKVNETISFPMNLNQYTVLNSDNDISDNYFPDNIYLDNYNFYGNKEECENIKNTGAFKIKEIDESKPFIRCLFYNKNSPEINDIVQLYITHGNTEMTTGFINENNQVKINFWDFNEFNQYNTIYFPPSNINLKYLNTPSDNIFKFNNTVSINYMSQPKKLEPIFSNRIIDINNNIIYIYSPFDNNPKTIVFENANSIELINQSNNTNHIIVLEKRFNGDKLWKINSNFEMKEITTINTINEGIISSAKITNNSVYFWTGNNAPELKKYDFYTNNTTTVISNNDMSNNMLFDNNIIHWGVNTVNNATVGYFIYDRNNVKSLFSFNENDTSYSLNEKQNDMSVNHIVAYKMLSGYTVPYSDYATLNIVKSLEENKTIKLLNNDLYVVLSNEYDQDELIKYSLVNNEKENISNILYNKGKNLKDENAIRENEVEEKYQSMKSKILFVNEQYKPIIERTNNVDVEFFESNIIFSWFLDYEGDLSSVVSMDRKDMFFNDLTTILSMKSNNGNITTFDNYFEQWHIDKINYASNVHMIFSYPEKTHDGKDTLSTHRNVINHKKIFYENFNGFSVYEKKDVFSFNFVERIRDFSILKNKYSFLIGMEEGRIDSLQKKIYENE